jgi:hypothetical protein
MITSARLETPLIGRQSACRCVLTTPGCAAERDADYWKLVEGQVGSWARIEVPALTPCESIRVFPRVRHGHGHVVSSLPTVELDKYDVNQPTRVRRRAVSFSGFQPASATSSRVASKASAKTGPRCELLLREIVER